MRVIDAPIDLLVNAKTNANFMSRDKFAQLLESIKRLGFLQHVVVRPREDGRWDIVDGHHRRDAMRQLEHSTIPAVELAGDEDPRLVALALNRIRGETDLTAAGSIVEELVAAGLSAEHLVVTGFSPDELRQLVAALDDPSEPTLEDMGEAEPPAPEGAPVERPFLLELTFATKGELAEVRRALRKAAGKGESLASGVLRLVRGE